MATHEFLLPDVGEGLESGTIVQWLVQAGEQVAVDQIIVEIETDKAVVEIPAPVNGRLHSHGGAVGASLPVGAVLATFEIEAGSVSAPPKQELGADTSSGPELANSIIKSQGGTKRRAKRILASPATRKFARSNHIDIALISGSGSRGQVTQADVEKYLATGVESNKGFPDTAGAQSDRHGPRPEKIHKSLESRKEPLSGLRKQIANNMQSAWRDIPHVFTFEEIDATALTEARREINAEYESLGQRVSFLPFFVKACVLALQQHPRFNASLDMDSETVSYHGSCNIGIATATPEGLIVTVVHQAEQKTILEIAREISELASLARERRVSVEQIKGGTFTISNFGSYGGTLGTPIIRPPEVAIAGFGRIHEKVVAVDGQPAVRQILPLAVSADHRLNDGEHLGGFVSTLVRLLGNPVRMLGHL
ncbi:hypothetical protein AB833_03965 [Chromatiales bacterium (ex Bugula neritina AB1)]|nr:hypothetical protein AB833_03965 [Chromatiales bacterium (ex Bugula neritina AB1)]